MRKRPLAYIACVFLAGLAYQRYEAGILVVGLIFLVLREIGIGAKHKRVVKAAGRSLILLSAFLLGSFHMQREENFREVYMSKIEDGCEVTVWGELKKTETTDWGIRGILSDCYIRLEEDVIPCNDIMVYLSSNHFQMGEIHKITGKVNMFSEARNQGNFDSMRYYQSLKIDFAISEEQCVILSKESHTWKLWLEKLRDEVCAIYNANMDEKAAGFYQGMVLGDKTNLDEEIKNLFFVGGISHILAISGLHVSIIGRGVYQRLRGMGVGFLPAGVIGGCLLVAYCIMVGNGMSTVRAVGMMLIYFWGQWIGRSYDMLNTLGTMVLLLLWENPFLIEYSGFWFSVMALVGVGYVGKELTSDRAGNGVRVISKQRKTTREGFWISLGITLTTLPITALSYYEIPLYSTLVNFIALPLLTPVFCLAIFGGILGIWWEGLASLLLQPCEWLFSFYEWLCDTVSKLPGASIICGEPDAWQVVLYYGVLFGGIYTLRYLREQTKEEKENLILGVMIFICSLCIFLPKTREFEITFLDVGQGDGIYISAGDGTTYFIDGGSSSVDGVGEYRILPFLKSKGVKGIDYWFVSHCDSDHVSGLIEVLESNYRIEYLVVAKHCPRDDMYGKLIAASKQADVEVLYMDIGDRIRSENMQITCLAPSSEQVVNEDRNESSLVLQMDWKSECTEQEYKCLFAGDISTEIEEILCDKNLLEDIDLFKANHHGSNYSNSTQILGLIQPEYIVVSCGENNLYGHPGAKAVERMEDTGAEIFYTMDGGQITFPLLQ